MPNCDLCPRQCAIHEGDTGFCGVRTCRNGKIGSAFYGRTPGFAVDPIEKKPFNHFYPGSKTLSFGSIGCNLACKFCQNWETAQSKNAALLQMSVTPEDIVELARQRGCESVAFTYNEPVTNAEFVMDVAQACRLAGLKTMVVSNGFISESWRARFFANRTLMRPTST